MKTIKVVGLVTRKVYAQGSEAHCHRKLSRDYPTQGYTGTRGGAESVTYKEPLKIMELGRR